MWDAIVSLLVAYRHEIHVMFWTVGSYFLFSAAVGTMPMPKDSDPHWQKLGFQVLNTFAGNLSRAFASARDSVVVIIKAIRNGRKGDDCP